MDQRRDRQTGDKSSVSHFLAGLQVVVEELSTVVLCDLGHGH